MEFIDKFRPGETVDEFHFEANPTSVAIDSEGINQTTRRVNANIRERSRKTFIRDDIWKINLLKKGYRDYLMKSLSETSENDKKCCWVGEGNTFVEPAPA